MAKKPRTNPSAEFVKNSADIIKALLTSAYAPIARLASVDAYEAARDRVTTLLNVPDSAFSRDDFRPVLIAIGNALKDVQSSKEYINRFKKDANGYTFTFYKKGTQGGELTFGTLIEIFPGATVKGFRTNLSKQDKLSVFWAMMAAAGFNFTPSSDSFEAYYTPEVILKDNNSRRKLADRDEIELATGDISGIAGLVDTTSVYANYVHNQSIGNASFQSQLKFLVNVTDFGNDVTVTLEPRVDVSISSSLVPYMAETNDKSAIDYLVYAWMTNALDRSLQRARSSTQNLPAVDLRITSGKLRDVARKFQVAKPRLNEFGFCINNQGVPMWVPEVDNCEDFMRSHQNFSVDDEGYLKYEDVAVEWANKLVLVDWFNDVIVYTQVNGKLAIQRLLGYIPLDKSSEYIYLNSTLIDRRVKKIVFNTLPSVVDSITTAEEAMNFLPEEFKNPQAYNAGKITKNFASLIAEVVRPLGARLNYADPDFLHEGNGYSVLVKHLFGLDLQELPEFQRGVCAHISAYLKAASKQRKQITMAIRDRLVGLEYFLIMPTKFTEAKWKEVKDNAIQERERRRSSSRLLSEIDVPNLDAGENGNLKGWMPHQVRIISDYEQDADNNITGAAAGAGKTALQLVDIIKKIQKNPSWRPLVTTKPGLIKNFISEVNYFTKGKVNVVSLRMSQLRYIGRTLKIQSAESVIRWVKSFPPNTIFICAYTDFASSTKLFSDLEVPDRVMLHDVALPQFVHVLRIIGFDVVRFDESHQIKNMNSKRSRYAFSILAQAKSKALLSGTIVSNTAVDLVGQAYGVNPMVFGSDIDDFKDEWGLPKSGLIKRDEVSFRLNTRMKKFTQMSAAVKEDWAFVLPDLYDRTLAPQFTVKQAKFYELMMQEAQLEVEAALAKKGLKKTDEEEEIEGDDDEDDADGAIIAAAEASLAKVAQWIVSPDTNTQYLAWKENPSGDDLISPIVKAIDAELAKIYVDRAADHSNNKSIVFGIHKVASKHFMKYSKFKDLCLHYVAGDDDILRVFEADPDKYVLVADGTSLREGKNMQYVSWMFSEETFWAPGDYEQIVSRMYRPDPKGKYNKDVVTHFWVTPVHKNNQPTFSSVKLARMISKAISMARLRYEGDPRWFEVSQYFEDLDVLTMNLETIFNSSHNDLAPYFNAWTRFIAWERTINQNNRIRIAKELEAENPGVRLIENGKVLDRNLFTKMVMREAKSTTMLPGSKRVFTPWEPGAVPADLHDLKLTILGADPIERGAYVLTEYGPGIVHGVIGEGVVVELYNRKKVKINKERIAIPNGDGLQKLTAIITNPSAWQNETYVKETALFGSIEADASMAPRAGRGIKVKPSPVPSTPIPASPINKIDVDEFKKKVPKPPVIDEIEEEEEALPIEEIYTYLINGMPALAIMEAPSGVENLGWTPVAPFVAMSFDTWTTAEKFLDSMTNKFAIQKSKLNMLEEEMDEFRAGRTMRLNKRVTDQQARNFFLSNHRKLATANDGRERVDPYWIGIDKNVYLAFSRQSHSSRVFTWLTTMANKNRPRIKTPKNVPEMHINIFSTLNEAVADLKALGQAFDIPEAQVRQELRELKEDVIAMRGARVKPTRGTR